MAEVIMPSRKQDDSLQKLLTVGGAVVGGASGGPTGAMTGAQAGNMTGGMMTPKPRAPEGIQNGAMGRRQASLDESNIAKLQESIDSLKYVEDPNMQQALAKPLLQASAIASKGQV